MSSILGIGLSGINAAQAGLLVTGHNITNSSTEGFHRQQSVQGTQIPEKTGSGFFGNGTVVETVRRAYSQFLDGAVLQAETQASYLSTYGAQIAQIDNMLADPAAGLSPALQSFFSGVQDVASNPASVPSRQQLLSFAQALVTRFQSFDSRLTEMRAGVNSQMTSITNEINSIASQIATSNQQIVLAQAGDQTHQANDLLDQRDQLIAQLNKLVRVSTVTQSNGTINVFIGNGQSLVLGTKAYQIEAAASSDDMRDYQLYYVAGNNRIPLSPERMQGGALGGLLAFRSQSLDAAQNQLGLVATVLAQTFNDQHHLGMDLEGQLGTDFFDVPAAAVLANRSNAGNAVLTATNTDVGALIGSDYRLERSGSGWTLTHTSDGSQTSFTSFPQTVDGVTLNLSSGAASVGDSFLIQPTRNGARDIGLAITNTAKVAAAAPILTAADVANTGKAVISAGVAVDTTNAAFATTGQLTPPILVRFTSATQYSIYDNTNPTSPSLLEANLTYSPAATNDLFPTAGSLDYGYRISLTGSAAAGDEFTVSYNTNGVADNRNALLLAGLQTKNTVANGTANYQSAYTQLVSQVGNRARDIEVQSKAQDALVSQTRQAQQSLSGVNLDEEAANLIRYQQAYQAAGKVLQLAAKLFDTILELN
ncbi:MAG TPA: flagellar hook-associated protein FlgK [Burkholderiales bacterium]|nr:flagellar hook-associated protein FlgK [Burkholderiales bacterium]